MKEGGEPASCSSRLFWCPRVQRALAFSTAGGSLRRQFERWREVLLGCLARIEVFVPVHPLAHALLSKGIPRST
jgi:hypothetical protein